MSLKDYIKHLRTDETDEIQLVTRLFQAIDENGNGILDHNEVVKSLPPPAEDRVKEMDTDGDGEICLLDFLLYWDGIARELKIRAVPQTSLTDMVTGFFDYVNCKIGDEELTEIVRAAFSGKPRPRKPVKTPVVEDAWEKVIHPAALAQYAYNAGTGYKQWNCDVIAPEVEPVKPTPTALPAGWELLIDDSGQEFFYCVTSGEMSRKPPIEGEKGKDMPPSANHRYRCARHRK